MLLKSFCFHLPVFVDSLLPAGEAMATELDERILEQLYTWIDSIPLTRPKRDLKRDFSDGGMIAQWLRHRPVKQQVSGSNPGGGK